MVNIITQFLNLTRLLFFLYNSIINFFYKFMTVINIMFPELELKIRDKINNVLNIEKKVVKIPTIKRQKLLQLVKNKNVNILLIFKLFMREYYFYEQEDKFKQYSFSLKEFFSFSVLEEIELINDLMKIDLNLFKQKIFSSFFNTKVYLTHPYNYYDISKEMCSFHYLYLKNDCSVNIYKDINSLKKINFNQEILTKGLFQRNLSNIFYEQCVYYDLSKNRFGFWDYYNKINKIMPLDSKSRTFPVYYFFKTIKNFCNNEKITFKELKVHQLIHVFSFFNIDLFNPLFSFSKFFTEICLNKIPLNLNNQYVKFPLSDNFLINQNLIDLNVDFYKIDSKKINSTFFINDERINGIFLNTLIDFFDNFIINNSDLLSLLNKFYKNNNIYPYLFNYFLQNNFHHEIDRVNKFETGELLKFFKVFSFILNEFNSVDEFVLFLKKINSKLKEIQAYYLKHVEDEHNRCIDLSLKDLFEFSFKNKKENRKYFPKKETDKYFSFKFEVFAQRKAIDFFNNPRSYFFKINNNISHCFNFIYQYFQNKSTSFHPEILKQILKKQLFTNYLPYFLLKLDPKVKKDFSKEFLFLRNLSEEKNLNIDFIYCLNEEKIHFYWIEYYFKCLTEISSDQFPRIYKKQVNLLKECYNCHQQNTFFNSTINELNFLDHFIKEWKKPKKEIKKTISKSNISLKEVWKTILNISKYDQLLHYLRTIDHQLSNVLNEANRTKFTKDDYLYQENIKDLPITKNCMIPKNLNEIKYLSNKYKFCLFSNYYDRLVSGEYLTFHVDDGVIGFNVSKDKTLIFDQYRTYCNNSKDHVPVIEELKEFYKIELLS